MQNDYLASRADYWVNRFHTLDGKRSNWKNRWQKQYEYCYPSRATITTKYAEGERPGNVLELVDSTSVRARNILAASLHGTLTGPHIDWFSLGVKGFDPNSYDFPAILQWAQYVQRVFRDEYAESNFYPQMREFYNEIVTTGIAGLWMEDEWDYRNGRYLLCFDTLNCEELCIEEDQFGIVDTIIRPFKMTVRNIAKKYPYSKEIDTISAKLEKASYEEVELLHVVYPKADDDYTQSDEHRYVSLVVVKDSKEIVNLTEGGELEAYTYCPCLVVRWDKPTNEVYADCPSSEAMPDILSVNTLKKQLLQNVDTYIRPYIFSEEGNLISEQIVPGALTEVQSLDRTKIEWPQNSGLQIVVGMLQEMLLSVDRTFMVDQLQLPPMQNQGTPASATEIQVRFELMQRILGPSFGRFIYDFVNPLIDNSYHVLSRRPAKNKVIPDFPIPNVELKKIDVEYIGPLRVSQEMPQLQASQQIIAEAMTYQQNTGNPVFSVDVDGYFRKKAEVTHVWPEVLLTKDVEDQRKEQFQQQQQAMAEMQMLEQASKGIKNVAEAGRPAQAR